MVILIVEDEILIGMGLSLGLGIAGHRVRGPAGSVDRALAIAAEEPPELAFVDVNLAGGDEGLDLARTLHVRHGTTIIFLTAQPERAYEARDIALGVITKPYDPQAPVRAAAAAAEVRAGGLISRAPPGLELFR
jgi:two-component system, response regulator PdtaR